MKHNSIDHGSLFSNLFHKIKVLLKYQMFITDRHKSIKYYILT